MLLRPVASGGLWGADLIRAASFVSRRRGSLRAYVPECYLRFRLLSRSKCLSLVLPRSSRARGRKRKVAPGAAEATLTLKPRHFGPARRRSATFHPIFPRFSRRHSHVPRNPARRLRITSWSLLNQRWNMVHKGENGSGKKNVGEEVSRERSAFMLFFNLAYKIF